jgi:hypothetical protein
MRASVPRAAAVWDAWDAPLAGGGKRLREVGARAFRTDRWRAVERLSASDDWAL